MFSGIEVIPALPVDPKQKLATTWGALKGNRKTSPTAEKENGLEHYDWEKG